MTVKVTKPAFNIRENLSEVDIPLGSHGSQVLKSDNLHNTFNLVGAARKNLLINGAAQIDQRGDYAAYDTNTIRQYGGPDRWHQYFYSGSEQARYTIKQGGSGVAPTDKGFRTCFHIDVTTADTAWASGDSVWTSQRIEGYNCAHLKWGTSQAEDLTLSFWVKSDNVTGVFSICLSIGGNGNERWIDTYTIDNINVWEYKTITIPGHTSAALTNDTTGVGLELKWVWIAGSSRIAQSRRWATQDNVYGASDYTLANIFSHTQNNIYLAGMQLETGSSATPFEHRSYGEELALCQRYFAVWPPRSGGIPAWPVYTGSTQASAHCWIPYNMRTIPTPTDKGTGTSTTTGYAYNNNGAHVSGRYANGTSPTLTCGGDSDNGNYGINMHFGSHNSSTHEADTASWNGTSPGIFLSAEL